MISSDRPSNSSRHTLIALCLALAGLGTLAGCAPLVIGGAAATTASVATDRRTAGEQLEDKTIQIKISNDLAKMLENRGRTNVVSYAGRVLLLGDVPTEADKQQAEEIASKVEHVRQVYNQIRVGDITPLSVRSNDTWLTTKVTSALINTQGVPTRTISVTTERGIVYLMGKLTSTEAQIAAKAASGVSGVNKVVTLFDIVSPESVAGNSGQAAPVTSVPTTSSNHMSEPTPDSAEVQAIPVQ
ncbi:BON domain-containing protein [Mesopusillimonas faecipullorum]|uniref:BON domain-containing protein n=1 Tax=Mesopusillimonas faecipullorum TaxID=2755040 RepID=UPI001D024CA7|nr:BON domain-containing protein [Mesopusillimonas faecipullorum]